MILAGDVGGTKTLLGLFQRGGQRPHSIAVHEYRTLDFPSFTAILDAFASDIHQELNVERAAIGVAGPIINQVSRLTHIPWHISADEVADRCQLRRVRLINDLEALATSLGALQPDELLTLQTGTPAHDGNVAVIAAGTGLGEACAYTIDGHTVAFPSEGGHADFAARTPRELELVATLRTTFGRVSVEQVVSGKGLANLYAFTHPDGNCPGVEGNPPDPADVSRSALADACPRCVEALNLFVSVYGSEAGNLALRAVAVGGVFVGGGIAPKILPALQRSSFMQAFREKPPMDQLLSRIPVKVILNPDAGLLGAAVFASHMA